MMVLKRGCFLLALLLGSVSAMHAEEFTPITDLVFPHNKLNLDYQFVYHDITFSTKESTKQLVEKFGEQIDEDKTVWTKGTKELQEWEKGDKKTKKPKVGSEPYWYTENVMTKDIGDGYAIRRLFMAKLKKASTDQKHAKGAVVAACECLIGEIGRASCRERG